MPAIAERNLRSVDLNLLVVFDTLMAERNVTRAAARNGLSQPAVSKALNRLRYLFEDPLFVLRDRAMEPTPRARQLAGPAVLPEVVAGFGFRERKAVARRERALGIGPAVPGKHKDFTQIDERQRRYARDDILHQLGDALGIVNHPTHSRPGARTDATAGPQTVPAVRC